MRYSSAYRAKKRRRFLFPIIAVILVITGLLATQLPGIKSRLAWRVEIADAYLRGIINPVEQMPAPRTVQAAVQAATPTRDLLPLKIRRHQLPLRKFRQPPRQHQPHCRRPLN